MIHSYPRFIELITFFPHIQYQDKRTPEDSQTIMPPLIPELGTVPALFGQAKQKQKAKQSSSQPRALPRTQAPDPIAIDLARDQRQQCCLYLLQRVMETQLRRAEQAVEPDRRVYRITIEQQEALDDLRAQGFRGGMGLDGTPLISPTYPSSGSQISPSENTHRHGPHTDGPSDVRLDASNLRAPISQPSTRGPVKDENIPAGTSRSTSISPTRFQQRCHIGVGSQQHGRESNQNKVPLSKNLQATSSQQIEESSASQSYQKLPAPDTNGIPGSYFPEPQTSGEATPVTKRSPNTSPPQHKKSSSQPILCQVQMALAPPQIITVPLRSLYKQDQISQKTRQSIEKVVQSVRHAFDLTASKSTV